MADHAALREAIIRALPIDWNDRTTVIGVYDDGTPLWSKPEVLADAILAAITPVLAGEPVEYCQRPERCAGCTDPGPTCLKGERFARDYGWKPSSERGSSG